jgi:hypothetical protein
MDGGPSLAAAAGVPASGRFLKSPLFERRMLLALVAALAIIALLSQVVGAHLARERPPGAVHSSWSFRSSGFRAFHDVLARLGYRVERFARSYASLPPGPECVLLVLDPDDSARAGQENRALEEGHPGRLRRWVDSGGAVVMTLPGRTLALYRGREVVAGDGEETIEALGKALKEPLLGRWRTFAEVFDGLPAAEPGPAGGRLSGRGGLSTFEDAVPGLDLHRRRALRTYLLPGEGGRAAGEEGTWPVFAREGDYRALLTLADRPFVLERRPASGENGGLAIAVATALPFANAGLGLPGAAEAAVALVDLASEGGRRRILFDEYTHGVIRRGGFLRWARETALFYPLATALLAAALLAWYGAVRFGPPTPRREVPRRAKEEFVLGLGDLYRRGGHGAHALRAIARGYEARLALLSGGAPADGDDAIAPPPAGSEPVLERSLVAAGRALHRKYTRAAARLRGMTPGGEGR